MLGQRIEIRQLFLFKSPTLEYLFKMSIDNFTVYCSIQISLEFARKPGFKNVTDLLTTTLRDLLYTSQKQPRVNNLYSAGGCGNHFRFAFR